MNDLEVPPIQEHRDKLRIVAFGTSAGGLAALKAVFANVPANSGLAYVIVMHLSPEHESHLDELLQPHMKMPIQQVRETVALEADRVYVIPPNANLDTIDTHLRLSQLESRRDERAPIDHFFRTLADTHDVNAIGVILSGTGSDGTLGLRRVKERGGLTIVQDPAEAEYDGMPWSAVTAVAVDLVLPLAEIGPAILRFCGAEPQLIVPRDGEDPGNDSRQLLRKVFAQIRARTGRDFSHYKDSTLLRRITRRMQFNQVQDPAEYVEMLRNQPEEVHALADDLLITVTSFFRDSEVFEILENTIIPKLFEAKGPDETVRVWCVGCATGEEAYSLAILLLEEAAKHEACPAIQIFASDLHHQSVDKAREGFYPGDIEADVTPARLNRFFHGENGGYRVRKEVRELVVFAPHNILADPPFSRVSLISCRNLLIYLQRGLQRQVAELFHYALDPHGFLVLGTSENIDAADLFRARDKKRGIYQKSSVAMAQPRPPVFAATRSFVKESPRREQSHDPLAFGALHQKMIENHGPPSILVSPDDCVVHISGRAGRYLVHPVGTPTTSVFKIVRDELRIELRTALLAVRTNKEVARSKAIPVCFNGSTSKVTLELYCAREPQNSGYVLLTFAESSAEEVPVTSELVDSLGHGREYLSKLREVEAEKQLVEQRLQAIIDEYDTSQEEIRASNEELQSANEELRSTLEELETSKEELQSMNEELQTVNQENRHKVEELGLLSNDLQNLFGSTDIATLFLDRELRILRFTPKVSELFNVRLSDRGRPMSDFTNRLGYDALATDTLTVLQKLVPIEREVRSESGQWYLTRVLPYRSEDDRIAGVVVTFVDISKQKTALEELQRAKEYSEYIIEALPEPLLILDERLCVISANAAFCGHFQLPFSDVKSRKVYDLANGDWNVPSLRHLLSEALPKSKVISGYLIEHAFQTVGHRTLQINARLLDSPRVTLLGIRDISERVETEKAMAREAFDRENAQERLREAGRQKDEYLAMLGHELRNPLAAIRSATELLKLTGNDAARVRRTAEVLDRQSSHMSWIIDGLLDVSRIVRGKVALHLHRVDLREIVERTLDDAMLRVKDSPLEFKKEFDSGDADILGDEVRLTQVFDNLIGNAIKFTNPPGTITVSCKRDAKFVTVRIRDTGIGIRPEMMTRLFESFQQETQDIARASGGLGLGLALAKGLVELHQGFITARSDGLGKGSEFEVKLPLAPPAMRTPRPATAEIQSRHILVVEDNTDGAEMLRELLELAGYQVTLVCRGQDVIPAMQQHRPDLVLCDLGLPGINGYDVARAVRLDAALHDVPLVALTGYGHSDARQKTAEAGFNEHLVKPVDLARLNALVEHLLSGSE